MRYKLLKAFGIVIGAMLLVVLSYYQFMGMQALLTIISKEGTQFISEVGAALVAFELTALIVFVFRFWTWNSGRCTTKYLKFLFRNSIVQMAFGVLATIAMIINTASYKNWNFGGPTRMFPIDFLLIAILGIVVGVIVFISYYRLRENAMLEEIKEPKRTGKQTACMVLFQICYYVFAFVAFDRLGAVSASVISLISWESFVSLIPLYLFSLTMIASLICYEIYKLMKCEKCKMRMWLISTVSILVVAIFGLVFVICTLLGSNGPSFMRLYSMFYGADRLISLPLTLIAIAVVAIAPALVSLILFIVKFIKDKKQRNIA